MSSGWSVATARTVPFGMGLAWSSRAIRSVSHWILADLHLDGLAPSNEIEIYWHADGVLLLFPISPGRYRVIADVKAGERPSEPTLDEVQALLDQRGPGGVTASAPVWLSPFTINERKVADYRAGRVFLAGDAAISTAPPAGRE